MPSGWQTLHDAWARIVALPAPTKVLAIYVAAKLSLVLGVWLALGKPDGFMHALAASWDGQHFLDRARDGYGATADYAFPPLYPLLIRLLGGSDGAAVLIANIAGGVAVYMVARLWGFGPGVMFACFPTWLLFSTAAYSESLFVALACVALWQLRDAETTRQGAIAGVFAVLAIMTRYAGAVGFGVLGAWILWRRRKVGVGLAGAGAVGGLVIAAWHRRATGDAGIYFEAQKEWGAELAWPWEQLDWLLHGWFTNQGAVMSSGDPSLWVWRSLAFWLVAVAGAVWLARDRRWPELAFSAPLVVLVASTIGTPAISLPRLMLAAFPAVAYAGHAMTARGAVTYALFATAVAGWLMTGHVTGQFIA